jgi:hypothetical protein
MLYTKAQKRKLLKDSIGLLNTAENNILAIAGEVSKSHSNQLWETYEALDRIKNSLTLFTDDIISKKFRKREGGLDEGQTL